MLEAFGLAPEEHVVDEPLESTIRVPRSLEALGRPLEDLEEAAVCYLQVLLADLIDGVGRDRIMADMDAWGYSFRLGSTRRWFEEDADDAREFLLNHKLIDERAMPTLRLRA